MDAVYLVREGDNEELRYSLRSLVNVSHGRVWIVGHKPGWVQNVEHLPLRQGSDRYANTLAAVHTACTHPDISPDFQLWNDDFYALTPTEIPTWHLGPVTMPAASGNAPHHQIGRARTAFLLKSWGFDPVLDYAVHVPMVINQEKMVDALRRAGTGIKALHRRTLYGNLHQIGGDQVEDVAVSNVRHHLQPGQVWVSTSDTTFNKGAVGEEIRARFSDPSPYELH